MDEGMMMMKIVMNEEWGITLLREQRFRLPLTTHHLLDLLRRITGRMSPGLHDLLRRITGKMNHHHHHHTFPTPTTLPTFHPPPKNQTPTLLFHQNRALGLRLIPPLLIWSMLLMMLKPIIPIVRIFPHSLTIKPSSLLHLISPTGGLLGSSPRPIPTTPSLSETAISFLPRLIPPMISSTGTKMRSTVQE